MGDINLSTKVVTLKNILNVNVNEVPLAYKLSSLSLALGALMLGGI